MYKKYKATIIGLIFTLSGLLLYYTFIFPILIILPLPFLLELILKGIYTNQSYSKIGQIIIVVLTILLAVISLIFFRKFRRQIKLQGHYEGLPLILYMILLSFIIHPLVFYINLSEDWSRASDGQFLFSINETFQVSSLAFLLIGLIMDGVSLNRFQQSR